MNERNQPGSAGPQSTQQSCPPGSIAGSQSTSGTQAATENLGKSTASATSGTIGGTPSTTGTTGSTTAGAGSTATGNIATAMTSHGEASGGAAARGTTSGSFQESASSTREDMQHRARETGRQIREQATAAGEQLKHQAGETAAELKERGRTMAAEQKEHVADQISGVGAAIRDAAHRLHDEEDHNIARYTEALADQVDKVSGYLRNRDIGGLMHDCEDMARRRPELLIGGMFVTGLAIARFLKASRRTPRRLAEFGRGRQEFVGDRTGYAGSQEEWSRSTGTPRPLETASTGSLVGATSTPSGVGTTGSSASPGLAGASVTAAGYGASPDIPEPRSQPSFTNKPR